MLAKSVIDARASIDGSQIHEISELTPLAEILPEQPAPRLEPPRSYEGAAAQAFERLRSLRHYLPFFGKKRS